MNDPEYLVPDELLTEDPRVWDGGPLPHDAWSMEPATLRAFNRRNAAVRAWGLSVGLSDFDARRVVGIAQQVQRAHRGASQDGRPANADGVPDVVVGGGGVVDRL